MDPPITHHTTTTSSSGGPTDPTNIIKGKRTKRQRPTNINIITNPSTSYNAFNPSTTSSSDSPANSTTTEDEDTANCLILLSKGHNIYTMHTNNNKKNSNNNNIGESLSLGDKFNSKRYIQTSTDAVNGLTGIYVYECKTCSRTFSSFQALGGHRASHKKPRMNNEFDKRKPPPYTALSDEDEPLQFQPKKNYSSSSSSLSLQLNNLSGNTNKFISSKVHECSICGAEFNSGQALGGHMRRHRGNNTTAVSVADTATNTTLSLIPYSPVTSTVVTDDRDYKKSTDDGLCLNLDLNLPAPQEITVAMSGHDQDQQRKSSFKFSANQNKEQTTVHLSTAPTLVDCHY